MEVLHTSTTRGKLEEIHPWKRTRLDGTVSRRKDKNVVFYWCWGYNSQQHMQKKHASRNSRASQVGQYYIFMFKKCLHWKNITPSSESDLWKPLLDLELTHKKATLDCGAMLSRGWRLSDVTHMHIRPSVWHYSCIRIHGHCGRSFSSPPLVIYAHSPLNSSTPAQ